MSNDKSFKILLTGATGYLGSHLLAAFIRCGYSVVVLKRSFSNTSRIVDYLGKAKCYDIDLAPLEIAFDECEKFDAVVHTAVNYGRGENSTGFEIFNANVQFPLRLMQAAAAYNAKLFYNMSTVLNPYLSYYALSKRQFEQWGKIYADQGIARFVNLKLEHVYGPGDDVSKFTTHVVRSCLQYQSILALTPGYQTRDFIHVDDVVSACLAIMKYCNKMPSGFDEFEVGSGKSVSIREYVEAVQFLTGSQTKLEFGARPYRENETMHSQADISRLKGIGWKPKYDLISGLKSMIEHEQRLINKEAYACVT